MPQTLRPAGIAGPLLAIVEHRVGRRAVLSVIGEVDISTAANLRAAIETASTGAFELWIDLSETTFMDSTGLQALAEARDRPARTNLRLALICPSGPVLRLFQLTGLDRILEIHATHSEANYAAVA